MSRVSGSQAQAAAEALELWHALKRDHKVNEKAANALLDFLGFNTLVCGDYSVWAGASGLMLRSIPSQIAIDARSLTSGRKREVRIGFIVFGTALQKKI